MEKRPMTLEESCNEFRKALSELAKSFDIIKLFGWLGNRLKRRRK